MKIAILTLFPDLLQIFLSTSIIGRGVKKGLVDYKLIDIRQFGEGRHQVVDDRPFGGGPGMVFKPDIMAKAWQEALNSLQPTTHIHTVLMSASGTPFTQKKAQELSKHESLIIVSGHYEGIDQRFIDKYVDEEISIGDYVLTGGELPALVVTDAITRLIPGVLNKEDAANEENFSPGTSGLLEYPQYTRPEDFEGEKVPSVLLSGNHQEVKKWRQEKSLEKTQKIRPDLLK